MEELHDLYFHFKEKGAVGIGAYQDAMIPNIVANWADPLDGTISVSDPRDWYVEPFGFSQDELDVDAMDDDAVSPTQEPPTQSEQREDVPMATGAVPNELYMRALHGTLKSCQYAEVPKNARERATENTKQPTDNKNIPQTYYIQYSTAYSGYLRRTI